MGNLYYDKLPVIINRLSRKYSTWSVFFDFLEISAITISNCADRTPGIWEEREDTYLKTLAKYNKEEQQLFTDMFSFIICALHYEVKKRGRLTDLLGKLFHELELHNKYHGQFFTPQDISDLMGALSMQDSDTELKDKNFIDVKEPCCGSGSSILGFANEMRRKNMNYCTQLFVNATDIDIQCVFMCYIQLSLYGIPAIVTHGNSLSLKNKSHWFTPIYLVNDWNRKVKQIYVKEKKKGLIS